MGMQKYLATLTTILLLYAVPARADEPGISMKIDCMSEIAYLQVTTVFTSHGIPSYLRREYGMPPIREAVCDLHGKRVTLDIVETGWNKQLRAGLGKVFDLDGYQHNYVLTIFVDGEPVIDVEDFGSYQIMNQGLKTEFPQFLAFDGFQAMFCGGALERTCRVIPLGHLVLPIEQRVRR